jgi:hypothetical protein
LLWGCESLLKTRIVYGINVKKNAADNAKGPPQMLEAVLPGAVFSGRITLRPSPQGSAIRSPFTWDQIEAAAQTFFSGEQQREASEMAGIGIPSLTDGLTKSELLLRVGRHCGAECLTIAGHRQICTNPRNSSSDHATTLWLAGENARPRDISALIPFGWVNLQKGDVSLAEDREKVERTWQQHHAGTMMESASHTDSAQTMRVDREEVKPPILEEILLRELEGFKAVDAGPIGSIIQRIGDIDTPEGRALVAKAVREKLGKKKFKKHKRKSQLLDWIEKRDNVPET